MLLPLIMVSLSLLLMIICYVIYSVVDFLIIIPVDMIEG